MPNTVSSSRLSTPISPETVIPWPRTPQAPKKPKAKFFGYLQPTVYNPQLEEKSKEQRKILDNLSHAGVRTRPPPREKKTKVYYDAPRKLTVSIVDGKTDYMLSKYVPSHLLTNVSSKAAEVLTTNPCTGRYRIYGSYDSAIMHQAILAITLSQNMPVTASLPTNLLAYEACLRLGVAPTHPFAKPLVAAINRHISSTRVTSDILSFITYRLGAKDAVFKHTANVLCHQRFIGDVDDVVAFEEMLKERPALQKAMVQIDQAHKARRAEIAASKLARGRLEGQGEKAVGVGLGIRMGVEGWSKEIDGEQKEELLKLLKGEGELRKERTLDEVVSVEKEVECEKTKKIA